VVGVALGPAAALGGGETAIEPEHPPSVAAITVPIRIRSRSNGSHRHGETFDP